jgi:hypothetical protein
MRGRYPRPLPARGRLCHPVAVSRAAPRLALLAALLLATACGAAAEPPASLVREAAVALSHAPGPHLYARVDGCAATGDGALVLMELELLEPTLFFGAHPEAPRRFAVALDRAMSGHGPGDPGAAPSLY